MMKYLKIIAFALTVAFTTGCAGTNIRVDKSYNYEATDFFSYEIIDKANVTEKGMAIFKSRLDNNLMKLGLSGEDSNKVIEITFNNYYMRHGAARVLAGIMAGSDNITSTVLIKEKNSGNIIGKLQVVSKNPTTTGSAKSLIEQHADEITTHIKTGKL